MLPTLLSMSCSCCLKKKEIIKNQQQIETDKHKNIELSSVFIGSL